MIILRELVNRKIITQKEASSIEYEIQSSGRDVMEVLIEKLSLPERRLFEIKSEIEELELKNVYPEKIENNSLRLIPQNSAEQFQMVPIGKEDGKLQVGMVHPGDIDAKETLNFLSRQGGFSFETYLITLSDYREVMSRYQGLKKLVSKALSKIQGEETKKEEPKKKGQWGRLVEDAPISKVIDVLLRHALEGDASDVHIEPFGDRLRVRFRVLGDLYSSIFLPSEYLDPLVARVKILSSMRIDESRIPQDGRFSKTIRGRKIDFRVSTLPTGKGEKVAIRILDSKKGLRTFNELGLGGRNLRILKESIDSNSGLILVTGPTGSGKSTTLYAALEQTNKENSNVVTLEDPIEYLIEGINQSQIRPKIGFGFAEGLRHILRQDPDIIMVGEVRDAESADLVIHAGLTGHLVLSTLHTTNSFGAIPRLIDIGVDPYLIPVVVNSIVAQRLVRRLCDNCKKKVKPGGREERVIGNELEQIPSSLKDDIDDLYLWEPVGCQECGGRGFSDMIGVFEILKMTSSLSKAIVSDVGNEDVIIEEGRRQGLITMHQDAMLKALKGITTLDEALQITKSYK